MAVDLLTTNELAERLKMRPSTIKQWSRCGKIPTIWISNNVRRFDYEKVLSILKEHTSQGGEV